MDEQLINTEMRIREAQLQNEQAKIGQSQQEFMTLQEQQNGMIKEQLDSSEDIEKIYNLINGYRLEKNSQGFFEWMPPKNNDMIVLSKEGIQFVMGKILTYICKNTLLSNYSEEQINAKMEDISNNINDTVFINSDKYFLYPTLEDCKIEIKNRIQKKVEVKKFALELLGKKLNQEEEEKIKKEIQLEMENTIETELEIIKQQKLKSKYKLFESIIRDIQDPIHSAYMRAWKGEERTTLRKHTNITETRGSPLTPQQPVPSFNPFGKLMGN